MTKQETCPICNKRPVAYYIGNGTTINGAMCYRCYTSNPDTRERYQKNSSTIGGKGGARS